MTKIIKPSMKEVDTVLYYERVEHSTGSEGVSEIGDVYIDTGGMVFKNLRTGAVTYNDDGLEPIKLVGTQIIVTVGNVE